MFLERRERLASASAPPRTPGSADPRPSKMDAARSFRMELDGLDLQQVPVLSLDQIRAIRANNDYVERPAAPELGVHSGIFYAHDDRYPHGLYAGHAAPPPHAALPRSQSQQHAHVHHLSRSSTVSSSMSRSSAASEQRLLASAAAAAVAVAASGPSVRRQPKGGPKAEGKGLAETGAEAGPHLFICERCGRCKCGECRAPRRLPSCWLCGQRCLCSAQSALEHATCLCCVKGLFYHCAAQDDEDDCADRPCSCGSAHAAARWGAMGLLALCLPCLCCYPPARLCLAACQSAHDRATRPGCRCANTNTVCRKISASDPVALRTKGGDKPL